jgi:exopolysaccharide production protein ExoZ
MEGLRGIAVFLVFLVHYCSQIEPYIIEKSLEITILHRVHKLGNVGVDLFFILSGFLIYGTLIKKSKTNFFQYLMRRIVRIYPTFLIVFLIYLSLSYIFPNENKIPNNPFDAALYIVQNILFLPGLFDITPIITVAWSLSYEFFYYLFIPLIIALLSLRSWMLKQRIILWCAVSILGFFYFEIHGGPYRLLMFISGILLYEVLENKLITPPKHLGSLSLILALVLYLYAQYLELSGIIQMAILYVLFFIVCLEAFSRNNGSATWLNLSPIRWLGNMSYSYYLIHGLTLKACFMIIALVIEPNKQFDTLFWFAMPALFFVTLISSFILFILVEKPFSLRNKNRTVILKIDKSKDIKTLTT